MFFIVKSERMVYHNVQQAAVDDRACLLVHRSMMSKRKP
jgi:hypothetical protein